MTEPTGKPINLICPRCSHFIPNDAHPGAHIGALSRYGELGAIEVCSRCGDEEAMIQWEAANDGKDPETAVHPVFGVREWDVPNPSLWV